MTHTLGMGQESVEVETLVVYLKGEALKLIMYSFSFKEKWKPLRSVCQLEVTEV